MKDVGEFTLHIQHLDDYRFNVEFDWDGCPDLLMDEPASALDPRSTAKIEDLIAELRGDYTIVIVTHNMQQAARVSDMTAFFYEGALIEYGPTDRLFTKPRERQTEDYITGRFG